MSSRLAISPFSIRIPTGESSARMQRRQRGPQRLLPKGVEETFPRSHPGLILALANRKFEHRYSISQFVSDFDIQVWNLIWAPLAQLAEQVTVACRFLHGALQVVPGSARTRCCPHAAH